MAIAAVTVSVNPYFHHQGLLPHHQMNGTSTGQSSADGIESFGGGNSSETDDAILNGVVAGQPQTNCISTIVAYLRVKTTTSTSCVCS